MALPTAWQPCSLAALRAELGVVDWVLCGGCSIDLLVGRTTRAHGDVDIGVLRSRAVAVLARLEQGRVYLCAAGAHHAWDGGAIPREVHDIWVTSADRRHWSFQVMLYDDDGGEVSYRRDPRLRWPLADHAVEVGGVPILNPIITLLYKAQSSDVREKDIADLRTLIHHYAEQNARPGESRGGSPGAGFA